MHKWPSSLLILVRKNIGISIYIELLSPTMTTSVIVYICDKVHVIYSSSGE